MARVGQGGPRLVLASASPRRRDLLAGVGVATVVRPADIDETPFDGEKPVELVERLARAKAEAVWSDLDDRGGSLVLAADTVIDLDGAVLGKPEDDEEARRMLAGLSGRAHDVFTGVALLAPSSDPDSDAAVQLVVDRTTVWMRSLSAADMDWYLGTGEHRGKAGAYAIQGLGSLLVDRIEGSYTNVVGLPLTVVDDLARAVGHPLRELSRS